MYILLSPKMKIFQLHLITLFLNCLSTESSERFFREVSLMSSEKQEPFELVILAYCYSVMKDNTRHIIQINKTKKTDYIINYN